MSKYLCVTIHDNDFTSSLRIACEAFYQLCYEEDNYPDEEDFPIIREYFSHVWVGLDSLQDLLRWKGTSIEHKGSSMTYLNPELSFVEFEDIPDWDNHENVYIPMFDNGEILMR